MYECVYVNSQRGHMIYPTLIVCLNQIESSQALIQKLSGQLSLFQNYTSSGKYWNLTVVRLKKSLKHRAL
jgi:hypothetical protein